MVLFGTICGKKNTKKNAKYETGKYFFEFSNTISIGLALITKYTHVRNKTSNTQGSSPNVIFHTLRNCS